MFLEKNVLKKLAISKKIIC